MLPLRDSLFCFGDLSFSHMLSSSLTMLKGPLYCFKILSYAFSFDIGKFLFAYSVGTQILLLRPLTVRTCIFLSGLAIYP